MKLISLATQTQVNYFGILLYVPLVVNYLATDSNGELWGYNESPTLTEDGYYQSNDFGDAILLAFVDLDGVLPSQSLRSVASIEVA